MESTVPIRSNSLSNVQGEPVSKPRTSDGAVPVPSMTPRTSAGAVPLPSMTPRTSAGAVPLPSMTPRTSAGAVPLPSITPRLSGGAVPMPIHPSSPEIAAGVTPRTIAVPMPTHPSSPEIAAGVPPRTSAVAVPVQAPPSYDYGAIARASASSPLAPAPAPKPVGDVQVIRDALSIHHVPVVAALHWDKLHNILHSLCEQMASQSVRLDKAEAEGKNLKDEVGQFCKNVGEHQKFMDTKMDNLQKEMQTTNTSAVISQTQTDLEGLKKKVEELTTENKEQNEKLHKLEDETEKIKARLDQMTQNNSDDIDNIKEYCRNLRSDFEMKFLINAGKDIPVGMAVNMPTTKLEAALAELQGQMQKKADGHVVDQISQSTLVMQDVIEKMESDFVELQSQMKMMNFGMKRASQLSAPTGMGSESNQKRASQFSTSMGSTQTESRAPVMELPKETIQEIDRHKIEIQQVKQDLGLLSKSILILSGHPLDRNKFIQTLNPADKIANALHGVQDDMTRRPSFKASQSLPLSIPSQTVSLLQIIDGMDATTALSAVNDALRMNMVEPKENVRIVARLAEEVGGHFKKIQELADVKAEKADLHRLAVFMKEEYNGSESSAALTGKPISGGFKCISCSHPVERMNPVSNHVRSNRMPPQIYPMLSAERIFSAPGYSPRTPRGYSSPRTPRSARRGLNDY